MGQESVKVLLVEQACRVSQLNIQQLWYTAKRAWFSEMNWSGYSILEPCIWVFCSSGPSGLWLGVELQPHRLWRQEHLNIFWSLRYMFNHSPLLTCLDSCSPSHHASASRSITPPLSSKWDVKRGTSETNQDVLFRNLFSYYCMAYLHNQRKRRKVSIKVFAVWNC